MIVPTTGAAGIAGCAFITILADADDAQPDELLTIYEYVPWERFEIVIPDPEPVVVTLPGDRVRVHVPLDGNPLNTTLPVVTVHVGCVIFPITGAAGTGGGELIVTPDDEFEVQPSALVTLKVKDPEGRPEIVVLLPEPDVVVPPGLLVICQFPLEGNPFNITLPVNEVQVGCVITPVDGTDGLELTVSVNVATAAVHAIFLGIFVLTVITTCVPISPDTGL